VAKVIWTAPAVEDLRQIHQFIAKDSKQYAAIVVRSLRGSAERLRAFPESGRPVPELPGTRYREVILPPYRVIYRHAEEQTWVWVLAVVHGSRLLPPIEDGG
jgi:plasmid stabilization system protein ParE